MDRTVEKEEGNNLGTQIMKWASGEINVYNMSHYVSRLQEGICKMVIKVIKCIKDGKNVSEERNKVFI